MLNHVARLVSESVARGTPVLDLSGRIETNSLGTEKLPSAHDVATYLASLLPEHHRKFLDNVKVLNLSQTKVAPEDMGSVCEMVKNLPLCAAVLLCRCPFLDVLFDEDLETLVGISHLRFIVLCGSSVVSGLAVEDFNSFGPTHFAKLVFYEPTRSQPSFWHYLVNKNKEHRPLVEATHEAFFSTAWCALMPPVHERIALQRVLDTTPFLPPQAVPSPKPCRSEAILPPPQSASKSLDHGFTAQH